MRPCQAALSGSQNEGPRLCRGIVTIFAEIFSAYGAADYAGVVDEFLAQPTSDPRRPLALNT